jgi:hypothetical protein
MLRCNARCTSIQVYLPTSELRKKRTYYKRYIYIYRQHRIKSKTNEESFFYKFVLQNIEKISNLLLLFDYNILLHDYLKQNRAFQDLH